MTFRARLALVAAAAVALAVVSPRLVVYFVVRSELRSPIDRVPQDERCGHSAVAARRHRPELFHLSAKLGGRRVSAGRQGPMGRRSRLNRREAAGQRQDRAVARGGEGTHSSVTLTVRGTHVRDDHLSVRLRRL
jgi:hypothetical protein